MSKPKVIVTRRWPSEVEQVLGREYDTRFNPDDRPLSASELRDALGRADAVLPTVTDRMNAELLKADPLRARLIANYGVGFNHIDLETAAARGLTVTNTPEVLTDCTADLAMTLILMLARRAGEGERHIRRRAWTGWRPTHMMGSKVTGKTLGLIGMGRIARAVARRAQHGFGMKILFHDPQPPDPESFPDIQVTPCSDIEQVLANADIVSLHCPGGEATRHLINRQRLCLMRSSAFLINTARGDVVDEAALVEALADRSIAGAGLDVFEAEPTVSETLLDMENVVLLPHLGSASTETRVAMGMRVVENLRTFFSGEVPPDKIV